MRKFLLPLLLCLSACSNVPVLLHSDPGPKTVFAQADDLAALYAGLAAQGGVMYRLNPKTSSLRMYAFRAGRAAKFGHNHVLSAPEFQGFFHWVPEGATASRFDLAFRLDQLAFDDPQHRAALGSAFASTISAEDTASTRTNMLGDNNFQASRFPWLRVQSVRIVGDAPKFAARIAVELHGQSREMWVPLTVVGLPGHLNVQGAVVLLQSDFGIKAFSVFGGILAVQDALVVEFTLSGDAQ
ncbi:MAG: YceI family protein [Pseudomonadota bacterium]